MAHSPSLPPRPPPSARPQRSPSPTPRRGEPSRYIRDDSRDRPRDRDTRDVRDIRDLRDTRDDRDRAAPHYSRNRDVRSRDWDSRDRFRDRERPRDDYRDRPFRRARSPTPPPRRDREREYRRPSPLPLPARQSSPSPEKSVRTTKARSTTPEEGQITSPLPPARLPAPVHPLPPRARSPAPVYRPRSPSPPYRRRNRDRSLSPYPRGRGISRSRSSTRSRSPHPRRYDHRRSRSRSRSRSSASSRSQSTRYPSPVKPAVRYTPEKRIIPLAAIPPVSRPAFRAPPPSGPRSERAPPTGPRSLVIPSGPRGLASLPPTPLHNTPSTSSSSMNIKTEETPAVPHAAGSDLPINPYTATSSTSMKTPTSQPSARLSWSERKSLNSPVDTTNTPSTASSSLPVKPTFTTPISIKQEVEIRPDTPPVPPSDIIMQDISKVEVRAEEVKVEEKVVVVEKMLSTDELKNIRRRLEEERVMKEIAGVELKVSFGGSSWEKELAAHYQRLFKLEQNLHAAQSGQRIAVAGYADAEAERLAAGERRRVAESQLMAGSLGGVGVGILGGT